ncbi:nucleotidyl transferase AbiEii/AbiGii toxin family protein [Clostridium aestuarii]|uniref:Nucleotidyl transferase AbiEii/AbiGii toxin family protein n=1 Tax=Clostridium aestuarii TaxID=338193 RepID=A0ABT4D4J0_9CLOT|nr:nucleotidyl transferase AbiEii/AbiGii toxin family protein [Clostridium aestuarii]MCY6485125.1 nucleotidyl transferase AbiEii/AbiGii toxin family protein [Clostridium aestuarii]
MKTLNKKIFTHDYSKFTEEYIASKANYYGIPKNVLERQIWIYEIHSQIQKRLKGKVILKGGACIQLYLPIDMQRGTEDLDLYTDLTIKQLRKIMKSIEREFNTNKIHIKISEYIPESIIKTGKTLPITTFMFKLPLIFKKNKKGDKSKIKIDFLHVDINNIRTKEIKNGNALGLDLKYVPVCVDPYYIISSKVIIFAVNSIGIEKFKKDKLYKNIYDLFYMLHIYNSENDLKKVVKYIQHNIKEEFYIKKLKPIGMEVIFNDILQELYYLSLYDLRDNFTGYSKRFLDFQNNYIQYHIGIKLDFDSWSIMCIYVYLWTYALKESIFYGDYSKLDNVDKITKEHDYYKKLTKKEQQNYLNNIKNKLAKKRAKLNYKYVKDPLRLICMFSLYFKK